MGSLCISAKYIYTHKRIYDICIFVCVYMYCVCASICLLIYWLIPSSIHVFIHWYHDTLDHSLCAPKRSPLSLRHSIQRHLWLKWGHLGMIFLGFPSLQWCRSETIRIPQVIWTVCGKLSKIHSFDRGISTLSWFVVTAMPWTIPHITWNGLNWVVYI